MRIFGSRVFAICAAALIFAGCSGSGSPSPVLGYDALGSVYAGAHYRGGQRPIPFRGVTLGATHRDHHKSWLSPTLKSAAAVRELWVSDFGTYDVYIYALPHMALKGTLTGFNGPQGMCSDNLGHVWITNTYSFQVLEYAHNGSLVNTLSDPNGWPVSCAWDRKTGNLAVTNIVDFSGGHSGSQVQGTVEIYPGATETPTGYTIPNIFYNYSDGYDNNGNLFVDGTNNVYPYYNFAFGELPAVGSEIAINISGGAIYSPGGVQWNRGAHNVIVGDQECGGNPLANTSCLYAVSVSGSSGTITGSTSLNNSTGSPACDVVEAVRQANFVYGGDAEFPNESPYLVCASGGSPSVSSAAYGWLYPVGGNPSRASTNTMSEPDGVAISQ